MTGTRLRVMRELLREVVREAQGMVIPILSSFPRFRPSTISSRRWRPRSLMTLGIVSQFLRISQSFSLRNLRSVTQGGLRTSACMIPCLLLGWGFHWHHYTVSWPIFWAYLSARLLPLLEEYLSEPKSYGVISAVGTINLLWTSLLVISTLAHRLVSRNIPFCSKEENS